jgi:CheY-like chemotaxis protein
LIRVPCVDDDSGILELTETFLGDGDDIGVTPVLSATSALEVLEKEAFDVIVSDYRMPGMDGIELLKALRTKADRTPLHHLDVRFRAP